MYICTYIKIQTHSHKLQTEIIACSYYKNLRYNINYF